MATIRKRGDKWQAQVRRRGQTVSRSFIQRADAQRWAKQIEIEADQSGLSPDLRGQLESLSVSNLLIRFRDTVAPHRRGQAVETFVINAFLRNPLAATRLADLTPGKFASYRDQRLKSVRPGTVNRELGLIQHIFEIARTDWNIPLTANPVKAIRKPKADRARERRLVNDEWDRLLEACKKCRNRLVLPVVGFAVETGMRRGEILAAKWRDLNDTESTLRIPVTKNGEPRTIPLTRKARAILSNMPTTKEDNLLIFPMSSESIKLAWKRATARAGIRDLHFHDLRHEAVSRFFEQGLTVPEVALISGHKDPRMLFRYTHLRAEDVAKKLNSTK